MNILNPLLGGALIGLAATILLLANGRVMGVSGILGGLIPPGQREFPWRIAFLAGLLVGSFLIPLFGFTVMSVPFDRGLTAALIGGWFVGFGTTLGNGCTSGHGVCGISRLSLRSMSATGVFMALGILTVILFIQFFGGAQ